ncbi:hypothetical protein P691DRAFT_719982 [Macrolepiota fuliginosa MF-IS2]|uniref:Uncharacterized protein n=1 Tax=Macrolepiota fuliginosa MF-IS2 TaxID=1400762 RepID=A0A9P5XLU8_9AGAR|nr:hypothetical protein P691DRAFT_719982 [Macrolepiota fuliginosa MF-IS2]
MKSFFQRFHDSQPGTSKSRTKDGAYKQWTPSSKLDKDRAQPSNGIDPSTNPASKRLSTKNAGLLSLDTPDVDGPGRARVDYSTRFSTVPGASTTRHFPPNIPLSKPHPPDASVPKAPHLKPPDDVKEKSKLSPKRNEAVELSGNEKDVMARAKSERPSRSGQTSVPSTSQPHRVWLPPEVQIGSTEKGKKIERRKLGDDSDGAEYRSPRGHEHPDRKDDMRRDNGADREVERNSRQRVETKEKERRTRDRHREQVTGGKVKEIQQWEQQERDMYQLREREVREKERLRERKNTDREKAKDETKGRERNKGREKERDRGGEKEKEKEKEGGRNRETRGKEIDKERDRDRNREQVEKEQRQKLQKEKEWQLQWERQQKEAKERQEKERQAKEQRERERKERKTKERQQREREGRERLERERREKEWQEKEQTERERRQQERWEYEQDERERKAIERLEKERQREERDIRHKEQEPRQREPDPRELDLLRVERERQEQRKREREIWEQQREREREERERRRRGDRFRENPEHAPADARTDDKSSLRSKKRDRREGVSDSEREQGRAQELDRKQISRTPAQSSTPPEDRRIQDSEVSRPSEYPAKIRNPKQYVPSGGADILNPPRQYSKSTVRDGGYTSEHNQPAYIFRDPSGRNVPPSDPSRNLTAPPTQELRSPTLTTKVLHPMNPPGSFILPGHGTSTERRSPNAPTGYAPHPMYGTGRPDASNEVNRLVEGSMSNNSVPQIQPPQQSRSIAAPGQTQVLDLGHTLPPSVAVPAETNAREPRPSAVTSSTRANEHSSQDRLFSAPVITQVSHSNGPPASRIPPDHSAQEIASFKQTNLRDTLTGPAPEGHPVPTGLMRPNAPTSIEPVAPESRSFPSSHHPDRNVYNGRSTEDNRSVPPQLIQSTVPLTSNVSLPPPSHQGQQIVTTQNYSPRDKPLYPTENSDLPPKEHIVVLGYNTKGGLEPESVENIQKKGLTSSVQPILSGATTYRATAINKRPNTAPSQPEPRQDLTLPSATPKSAHTPRVSPSYPPVKILDTTIANSDTTMLQPNKSEPRPRISPHTDKLTLQESTPPESRQYLSDKSNNQDHRSQQAIHLAMPPPMIVESNSVKPEQKQRDHDDGHSLFPPIVENTTHSRHQRNYREGDIHRNGRPPPRSQPREDVHALDQQQTPSAEPKSETPPLFTASAEAKSDPKPPSVLFRMPGTDNAVAIDKKHHRPEPHSKAPVTHQVSVPQSQQSSRRPDDSGIGAPVSHHERMEEAARTGGAIVRPGTAVPRMDAGRPTIHEPPPQFTPPISHSQSMSVPQVHRPSTAIGIRPSVSSAPQSHTQILQSISSKVDRASNADTPFFPGKNPQPPVVLSTTGVEARYDHIPQSTTSGRHSVTKSSHPTPEAQIAPAPTTADGQHGMGGARSNVPPPSHKVSYSEGAITNGMPFRMTGRTVMEPSAGSSRPPTSIEASRDMTHQQSALPTREDRDEVRQHTGNKGESVGTQYQSAQINHPVARRDDIGNSTRGPPVAQPSMQPRQRKENSPPIHPEDVSPKALNSKEPPDTDPRSAQARSMPAYGDPRPPAPGIDSHYSSHRTETTRVVTGHLAPPAIQRHTAEANTPTSQYFTPSQQPSVDERSRHKHMQGNHSPNAPQRSPSMPINPASVSPQRTGDSNHSRLEEEGNLRSQRNPNQIKDARLAELLSPSAANDVPHQSYLQGARRTLASKLEQQPGGSPHSTPGNSGSQSEPAPRLRTSSRGEHSPRHAGGESSPSGPANPSPSYSHNPDLSPKDHPHVRTSPNDSQQTPSPRSRNIATEGVTGSQSGTHQRDEGPQHGPGVPMSRQPLARERRQDYAQDMEDVNLRKQQQTAPSMTYDANTRTSDTNRTSHIPSNSIPYPIWDQQAGKMTSQKNGQRRDVYDAPQSITIAHSRTRSESQTAYEPSASHSRHQHTTSRETYNAASSQTQTLPHVPPSNHVPPSSTTFGPLPDQIRQPRTHPSNQQVPISREDIPVPPQHSQAPPMKSTPSKRNYITPLPPETHNPNSSSATQPPTPKTYEIWLPPSSSHNDQPPTRSAAAPSFHGESKRDRDRDHARRVSTMPQGRPPARDSRTLPLQPSAPDPRSMNPYHYLKTRKVRTMSLASVEAQDGAASTVIGSPTTSFLSQAPIFIPPVQDPVIAAFEWTQASGALQPGRIRRPGLVWEDPEDGPLIFQQEQRRPEPRSSRMKRPRSSGSRSREASDTDQPSS